MEASLLCLGIAYSASLFPAKYSRFRSCVQQTGCVAFKKYSRPATDLRPPFGLFNAITLCVIAKAAMAPRKSKEEKLEDDIEMDDTAVTLAESDDEEGRAGSDNRDSENGDRAAVVDGQSNGDRKTKSTRVPKTVEEKKATAAHTVAATEAVSHLCELSWLGYMQ